MPFISLKSRGLETYYEEEGKGPPVVLIGGFTSTLDTWGLQVGPLSERFQVIRPDNRGSGRTRIPADDGKRSPQIWADDVLALIDALGLERVHLVGCSMGGFIAQAFAVAHPERLISLTLMCTTPGGAHTVPISAQMMAGLQAGSVPGATADQLDAMTAAALHENARAENRKAWDYFTQLRVASPHSAQELEHRRAGIANFTVWDQLGTLKVPTLVTTGVGDRLVPPENSRVIAERIPGAELKFIEGGGHVFFIEQPQAVNALLLDFLSRHSG
jgi:pimeloyl-ACP methyl ester carboxylesterase